MSQKDKKSAENTSIKGTGSNKNFLTVALGASAGGIKALMGFFEAMPADSGMAFVVILHLSQTHESNLAEILQRKTKMKVEQVKETIPIRPNHVYVIPPAKHLEMIDGSISLKEPKRIRGVRVPIDRFFRTLAEAYGRKAVCIILSGTGSDGTVGMKHIKGRGGFAIIQDPQEAEYNGMPLSAIHTRIGDVVLPVAEMPGKLIFVRDTTKKWRLATGEEGVVATEIKNMELLREVLTLLKVRTGHDFSSYKRPTLIRRLARHLQIHETDDLRVYLDILRKNPEEVTVLLKNLLINVTNFFRDKEAFFALEKEVIPTLFEGKTAADQVRVWVAGCASGEEAYSVAILLKEQADRLPDPPKIQVFASDVDEEALQEARNGLFSESLVADVSPERLQKFFVKQKNQSYRVRKGLREMVLFAPHNILRDPPFSRLDLVSCRNVMIYLNKQAQLQVLKIFYFALLEHRFLFLGSSETADNASSEFAAVDKKFKIYRSRPSNTDWKNPPRLPVSGVWRPPIREETDETYDFLQSFGELHHQLIESYAPPSILVNEEGEIVHLSENAGRFLRFAGGSPSSNITKAVHSDLLSDIRAALFTARKENKTVEAKNIPVRLDGENKRVNLTVRPVNKTGVSALIFFEESTAKIPEKTATQTIVTGDKAMETVVRRLEEELSQTRERLHSTVEQHETSIEELKASNEELQAINEEMRSTTEELETSKEEIQSVNEELTTVNHELKEKIEEVGRSHADLENLMRSTNIATIFLDRALNIKRYTPPTTKIFNLIPGDIGRPLSHVTHLLAPDHFQKDAAKVIETLQPSEREVHSENGNSYIARFSPYRTVDDKIEGIVISFIDITERVFSEQVIIEERAYARSIIDTVREPLIVLDKDLKVMSANSSFYETFDEKPREPDHRFIYELANGQWDIPALRELLEKVLPQKSHFEDFEMTKDFKNIGARTLLLNGREVRRDHEKQRLILLAIEDITDRKKAADTLKEEQKKKAFQLQMSDCLQPLTTLPEIEETFTHLALNYFEADRCYFCEIQNGKAVIHRDAAREGLSSVAGEYPLEDFPIFKAVVEKGEPFVVHDVHTSNVVDEELRKFCLELQVISFIDVPVIRDRTAVGILCLVQTHPRNWKAGEIEQAVDTADRIWAAIEKFHAEEALRKSEEKYHNLFNSIDEGFHIIQLIYNDSENAVDYRFLETNLSFEQHTGLQQVKGKRGSEIAPNTEDNWFRTYEEVDLSRQPKRIESFNKDTNKWFSAYAFPVDMPQEHCVAVLFKDITADKRQIQKQKFLLRLNDVLRPLKNSLEIKVTAQKLIAEFFKADRAFFAEFVYQDGKNYWKAEGPYSSDHPIEEQCYSESDFKKLSDEILKGTVSAVKEAATESTWPEDQKKAYKATGFEAHIAVPLLKEGRYHSFFAIQSREPRVWKKEEITLAKEAAERAWTAIEKALVNEALEVSEDRMRQANEAAGMGTFVYYPDQVKIVADQQLQVLFGLPENEDPGLLPFIKNLIHPEDLKRVQKEVTHALSPYGEGRFFTDFRIVQKEGEIRCVNISGKTEFYKNENRPAIMRGVAIDITRRKRAEMALMESEENYRVMVDQAVAGIMKLNLDGQFIFANGQITKMLGYSEEELLGMNINEIIHVKDREQNNKLFSILKNEGKSYTIEKRLKCKDGHSIWVFNQISPIFNKEGKPGAALIISVDISEQKAMDKQKDDFIGIASHELKTPLTGIKAYTELLLDQFSDKEESESFFLIEKLDKQVDRLNRLIYGLLDSNRVAEGRFDLKYERFDLNALIRERVSETQVAAPNHEIIVKPGKIKFLFADPERIVQVLTNLITNAVKYSPDADKIIITTEDLNGEKVKVNVRDFGVGVNPAQKEKIFKRFYRSLDAGNASGFGLGLFVSKEIIKLHSGEMGVDSQGEGSIFFFILPYESKNIKPV